MANWENKFLSSFIRTSIFMNEELGYGIDGDVDRWRHLAVNFTVFFVEYSVWDSI